MKPNRYVVAEITAGGALAALLFALLPAHPVVVYLSVCAAWVLLQLLSALAFCVAIYRGDVKEHRRPGHRVTFTPNQRARGNWLVMRHLHAYLAIAPRL